MPGTAEEAAEDQDGPGRAFSQAEDEVGISDQVQITVGGYAMTDEADAEAD